MKKTGCFLFILLLIASVSYAQEDCTGGVYGGPTEFPAEGGTGTVYLGCFSGSSGNCTMEIGSSDYWVIVPPVITCEPQEFFVLENPFSETRHAVFGGCKTIPNGTGFMFFCFDAWITQYGIPNLDVTIITPAANTALQDGVTFQAKATDDSDIDKVSFSVREPDGGEGIPVGYDDLEANFNTATDYWEYPFDTTRLQDGYYLIFAKATDNSGNEGMSSVVPFSIRNWAVITMLPSTANNKAGRTMPVKFSLRIAASVDPAQPFVYNEDLEIRIYDAKAPGTILQRSVFGDGSTNYRIEDDFYVTNFKTGKTPSTYVVEIWRPTKNFLVGSFAFKTVK